MKGRMIYIVLAILPALLVGCASARNSQVSDGAASPAVQATQPTTPTPVSQATQTVLASGNFVAGEHATTGSVTVVEENGQRYIEFGSDFSTDEGPDLVVILHRSTDVIGTTDAPAHAIAEADYVVLTPLQSINGTQRYEIPAEVDLAAYGSVAVWCRQFNATFGAASLSS